mmetsp:Transcript_31149/g.51153  ORF Transcript_31149/g.51153 Transcript_31149/m.51153 type:complete len:130 (+) Transcript_31149:232-621(+)
MDSYLTSAPLAWSPFPVTLCIYGIDLAPEYDFLPSLFIHMYGVMDIQAPYVSSAVLYDWRHFPSLPAPCIALRSHFNPEPSPPLSTNAHPHHSFSPVDPLSSSALLSTPALEVRQTEKFRAHAMYVSHH